MWIAKYIAYKYMQYYAGRDRLINYFNKNIEKNVGKKIRKFLHENETYLSNTNQFYELQASEKH